MKRQLFTLVLGAMSAVCFAQFGGGMMGGGFGGFGGFQAQGNQLEEYTSESFLNVDYVGDDQVYHKCDIYLPKDVKGPYPVAIHIYGSAWFSNNSKGAADLNTICAAFLKAGYAVVCPNHRSSSDAKWPAQINDIRACIRFVRGEAKTYNFDPSFVVTSGFSSGGHLSTVAATSSGLKTWQRGTSKEYDLEGNLGNYLDQSSAVQCACDWSGPNDLLHMTCNGFKQMSMGGQTPEEAVLGLSFADHQDDFAALSAPTYVDSNDVPIIIFHGLKDNVVPSCVSEILFNALQDAGIKTELTLEPEGGHGMGMYSQENLDKMIKFVNDVKASSTSGKPAKKAKKAKK